MLHVWDFWHENQIGRINLLKKHSTHDKNLKFKMIRQSSAKVQQKKAFGQRIKITVTTSYDVFLSL